MAARNELVDLFMERSRAMRERGLRIQRAISSNDLETVRSLVTRDNVNNYPFPLICALSDNRPEIAKYCLSLNAQLKYGSSLDISAMHVSAVRCPRMFDELLKNGGKLYEIVGSSSTLERACMSKHLPLFIVNKILESVSLGNAELDRALRSAVNNNFFDAAKKLIACGANVDTKVHCDALNRDATLLESAEQSGNYLMVEFLLANGATRPSVSQSES